LLFRWRDAILKSDLDATDRHVIVTLSLYMSTADGDCHPSITTLVRATRRSRRTVIGSLKRAESAGYLKIAAELGDGQGWKLNFYTAVIPDRPGEGGSHEEPASSAKVVPPEHEGGSPRARRWFPLRNSNSSELPGNSQEGSSPCKKRKAHSPRAASNLSSPSESGIGLATLLRKWILRNNPRAKITKPQEFTWRREADLMIRVDGRTEAEIQKVLEWSQSDSFWSANILSMGKLREKFDQLTLKAQRSEPNNSNTGGANVSGRYAEVPIVAAPPPPALVSVSHPREVPIDPDRLAYIKRTRYPHGCRLEDIGPPDAKPIE
jgi:hypothetical protein